MTNKGLRMPPTKSVQLIAFSRMSFLDISGPLDVFLTANSVVGGSYEPYDVSVVSPAGSVEMPAGIYIHADSDEAAPLFRDDCAPGFRDDLAPCLRGLQAVIVVSSFE